MMLSAAESDFKASSVSFVVETSSLFYEFKSEPCWMCVVWKRYTHKINLCTFSCCCFKRLLAFLAKYGEKMRTCVPLTKKGAIIAWALIINFFFSWKFQHDVHFFCGASAICCPPSKAQRTRHHPSITWLGVEVSNFLSIIFRIFLRVKITTSQGSVS